MVINNFSSGAGLPDSELWLPIPQHFGTDDLDYKPVGAELAQFTFDRVKAQCGFGPETIIDLVATTETKAQSLGGVAMLQTDHQGACGRYFFSESMYGTKKETITYDQDLENNPTNMIATFAHELSHALHNRSQENLEIEPELYELLTDLTAVYLGYGVFLANSRFEFSAYSDGSLQGWRAQGAGYLPESDLIFATAIFMQIKDIAIEDALSHLKPRLQKMLKKAFKQLSNYGAQIQVLKAKHPLEG
ncbi:MAG: hypothetical protein ABJG88_06225 [Litorimonas sp.]